MKRQGTPAMIQNCAIYLPVSAVDFAALLPGGVSDGGLFRKPTRYEFPAQAGKVRLSIAYAKDRQDHLSGLRGYVAQLKNPDLPKNLAFALIDKVQMIIGVELPAPIAPESSTFASLTRLPDTLGGFIFVNDSILTRDGFLVGPMTYPEPVMAPLATVQIDPKMLRARQAAAPAHMRQIRERTLAALTERGFHCSPSLPISDRETLRPAEEIARRAAALSALFLYVVARESFITTDTLRNIIARDSLTKAFTDDEAAILEVDRADAHPQFGDTIGWRLENIWPLAWVFGFEPAPAFHLGQISQDISKPMIGFLPGENISLAAFLAANPPRPIPEIVEMEDRFYCAHNAVRSAQLGSPSVPPDFHPLVDGGAVHERRHALTWCLSPGVPWEETDLST